MLNPFYKEKPTKIKNMCTFDIENTFLGIAAVTTKASITCRCIYKISIVTLYKMANHNKTNYNHRNRVNVH